MRPRSGFRRAFAHAVPALWGACCMGLIGAVLLPGLGRAAPIAAPAAEATPQPDDAPRGWLAVFKPASRAAKPAPDTSAVYPVASFSLNSGQSLHPSVAASGLTVVFTSRMKVTAPVIHRFGAEVEGGTLSISLVGPALSKPAGIKIDGAARAPGAAVNPTFTDWLTLKPGDLTLRFEFTRAGDAPARLRSMWEKQGKGTKGFFAEPIPSSAVLLPTGSEAAARSAHSASRGRMLLGELGCTHCHAAVTSTAILDRPAPFMSGIGARLSPEWLSQWVRDPQKVKPGCGMPDVLGESKQDLDDADSIVHFLASLGGPFEAAPVATELPVLDAGRKLFLETGCIACHGDLSPKSNPPAPYGNLAGKWNPSALSEFLQDPLATHPAGRMPSFNLTEGEADALATFLITEWGPGPQPSFAPDASRIEAGKKAFAARGCADCHKSASTDGPDHVRSSAQARPLPALRAGKGCLDPADKAAPRYTLTDADRADLAAALAQSKSWTGAPCPSDSAAMAIDALGCIRCHEWNEHGGVSPDIAAHFTTFGEADLGDEGRLPPRLTGVGAKLTTGWLRQVLLEAGQARPYMAARMPQFGERAVGSLPDHLAAHDGVWPDKDRPEPTVTPDMSQAGRALVGASGLNCIACHNFGDAPLAGSPGPDITAFGERLRYDWWRRYILAPDRFKPGTKMTNFFDTDSGLSSNTQILGGEPSKQADALWAYFSLGEFAPAPEGLPATGGLELRVGDRPLILRAFLKNAGSRGIAVGFPAGTHFAVDAEACRLAEVWTGKFLDATRAWAGRGGEVLQGQGPTAWSPPAGPALIVGPRPEAWPSQTGRDAGWRFKGYRVGPDGVPLFQYTLEAASGAVAIAERLEPVGGGGIRRTFTLEGAASEVWINAGAGVSKASADPVGSCALESVSALGGQTWFRVTAAGPGSGPERLVVSVETKP
jgi:mono/diheme cytochrome c family protein